MPDEMVPDRRQHVARCIGACPHCRTNAGPMLIMDSYQRVQPVPLQHACCILFKALQPVPLQHRWYLHLVEIKGLAPHQV
jgi:hypothetical protein